MIPMGKGNFRLEFKDWITVGVGAFIEIGSMVAVGYGLDRLKKSGEKEASK